MYIRKQKGGNKVVRSCFCAGDHDRDIPIDIPNQNIEGDVSPASPVGLTQMPVNYNHPATVPGLPLMRLNSPVCFGWWSSNVVKNPVNMMAKNPARHE